MSRSQDIGRRGEAAAAAFLVEECDYIVLSTNVRTPQGEIDLVCRTPEGGLAAVEVKASEKAPKTTELHPALRASGAKLAKLTALAAWLSRHYPDIPVQIDVVALHWDGDVPVITHFANVTA